MRRGAQQQVALATLLVLTPAGARLGLSRDERIDAAPPLKTLGRLKTFGNGRNIDVDLAAAQHDVAKDTVATEVKDDVTEVINPFVAAHSDP